MATDGAATSKELWDRTDPGRFDLCRNGEVVGELSYRHLRPNRYVLLHTEVRPDHRGQGVGSDLVQAALEEIRRRAGTVTAVCSFVADFLNTHQEFADIIDRLHPGYRDRASADEARHQDAMEGRC